MASLGKAAQLVVLAGLILPASEGAADTFSRGKVSLEMRAFEPDGIDETEDAGVSLTTEVDIKAGSRPWRIALRGFARLDAVDETRNIAVLQEAYGSYSSGPLTLRVGSQVVTWTATEAFHPSDIINSRNFDSDLENFEKLGEPMVELSLRVYQGGLSAYYMPLRITPNLLGAESRLSLFPDGFELGERLWVNSDGKPSDSLFAHQGGLRLNQTIGRADVSVHVVDHSDRHQPTFTFDPEDGTLRPTYHTVTQIGVTYVHVFGGLLVKLEAARRIFREPDLEAAPELADPEDHEQVAAGFEYAWSTDAGHEATVIAEYQSVIEDDADDRRALHVFQNDVLLGYRHSFNDVDGRVILVSFIADVEAPQEFGAAASYSQRLTSFWSAAGTVRGLRLLGKDINQAQVTLTRHF